MGRWDAEDFLDEIGAEQFELWREFFGIEPFGPLAEDQRAGLAMMLESNRHRGKGTKPYKLEDFMLSKVSKPKPRQLPLKVLREQMEAVLGKPDGQH